MIHSRGTAFIIVLWLIAILGALISAFSIVAVHSASLVESTRNLGQSRELARAGSEAWLGQVREHAIVEEQGVIVSEVLPYQPHYGLIITQVGIPTHDASEDDEPWIEIFNPTDEPLTYCGYSMELDDGGINGDARGTDGIEMAPGEYLYLCDGTTSNCQDRFSNADHLLSAANNTSISRDDRNQGGLLIGQRERPTDTEETFLASGHCPTTVDGLTETAVDRVSWETTQSPDHYWLDPTSSSPAKDLGLVRRTCSDHPGGTDLINCSGDAPLQTFHSANDWSAVANAVPGDDGPPDHGEHSVFQNPEAEHTIPILNNFVEIHNATFSDTFDVISDEYVLSSETSDGGGLEYELVTHPNVSQSLSELEPDMSAVIAHPEADFDAMGLSGRFESDNVLALTLEEVGGGDPTFLPMDTREMDTLFLEREDPWDVLTVVTNWSPSSIEPRQSRLLSDAEQPEDNGEWETRPDGGTPGQYAFVLDWHGSDWGWLGKFPGGASLAEPVYVPSFENSRQDSDIGYFRILRIEDESGKMDLRNPHNAEMLSMPNSSAFGRHAMNSSQASKVYSELSPENWMTHGDLMQVNENWHDDIYTGEERSSGNSGGNYLSSIYSPYRVPEGPRQTGLINVNMAPYEALGSIPRYVDGSDTVYMNAPMVDFVTDQRTPNPISPASDDDDYPELSADAFPSGSSVDPYRAPREVCKLFDGTGVEDTTDCDLMEQYTTVTSDGILTVEILGVQIDEDGNTLSQSRERLTVDRRALRADEGPLKILTRRFMNEEFPSYMLD